MEQFKERERVTITDRANPRVVETRNYSCPECNNAPADLNLVLIEAPRKKNFLKRGVDWSKNNKVKALCIGLGISATVYLPIAWKKGWFPFGFRKPKKAEVEEAIEEMEEIEEKVETKTEKKVEKK